MLFNKVNETEIEIYKSTLKVYAICKDEIYGTIICAINKENKAIKICDINCKRNNKGYGSLMMKELIEYAKMNKFIYINGWLSEVDVNHVKRLYHFYYKFGFEIIPDKDGMKFADIKLNL